MLCTSAAYAVARRLSVTFVKLVNISSFFFTIPSGSHTSFPYRTLRQHFDGDSLTGAKIAIFDEYLALRSITAGPLRVVKISTVGYRFIALMRCPSSAINKHHSATHLVYERNPRRCAEDNKTEFNCTHW